MMEKFERWAVGLEDVLGVPPSPAALFIEAFTHSSYAHERGAPAPPHNQRLEFLGDAVVGLAVADELWRRYPDSPEGELARARTALINAETLANVARSLDLGRWLLLGRGERLAGGRDRESMLCDVFEAVVGALFVGYGWEEAARFVLRQLDEPLREAMARPTQSVDAKTRLQELLHERAPESPVYAVVDAYGPDHARTFIVDVLWQEGPVGRGEGASKRAAEQAAAADALRRLDK